MAVRFQWLGSLRDPLFPQGAYEQLRQRCPDATPFNTLAWLLPAEAALGPTQQLQVLLAWQADTLCLCLPLVSGRERFAGWPFRVVRHLGFPLADRLGWLAELGVADLQQALGEIRRRQPHALLQLSELTDLPDRHSTLAHWMYRSSTAERRLSCRVPVHLIGDADREEVSGAPRYKLRRARKRIAACGAQVRRWVPDAASIGPLLQALSDVEAQSWKGDEGVGIFSPANRPWIIQAFTALAEQGLVRVVSLELDGRCISYRLGLLEHARLYDYNLAFLPQYADLGSGRVLLQAWIDWGLDDGWRWVDASRVSLDNSSHQLHERMSDQVEHWRWSFYSWRPSGICLGLGLRLWHLFKPWLRRRANSNLAPPAPPIPCQEAPPCPATSSSTPTTSASTPTKTP